MSLPLWTTRAFYSTSQVGCWELLETLLIHVQCVVSNMSEELLLFNDNLNGGVTRCFESRSQNMLDPTFPMMQVFKKKTSNMTQSVLVTSLWHHQGLFSLRMWTLPSVVCGNIFSAKCTHSIRPPFLWLPSRLFAYNGVFFPRHRAPCALDGAEDEAAKNLTSLRHVLFCSRSVVTYTVSSDSAAVFIVTAASLTGFSAGKKQNVVTSESRFDSWIPGFCSCGRFS